MPSSEKARPEPVPAPVLSVVLPVYDEEANLAELHRRLVATLEGLAVPFEIVYVDDGSRDGSRERLRELARADERVVFLGLSRNFGHQIALSAGLDHARGEAVVTMDSDLQDPPELIPEMVARWREGWDVVSAVRRRRPGESVFKRGTAYLFYRLLRAVAIVDIPPDTGDFRLLSRPAADALRLFSERNRFLRGLATWIGFRRTKVFYDRPARKGGESKYRLRDMAGLAKTAFFGFSRLPVTLLGAAGLAVATGALLALATGAVGAVAAAIFFLAGVQLVGLWVLGQYVLTIHDEVRGRPMYVVAERWNVPPPSPARATSD